MNLNPIRGEYFPWVEQKGIDRRYAVLEISTEVTEEGEYWGEVFDTRTHQLLWRSDLVADEGTALSLADGTLQQLEIINGFGSISLKRRLSSYDA